MGTSGPIAALVRRWRFFVPMLFIVIALTPLTYFALPPSYTSTSYVQMVPPLPDPTPAPTPAPAPSATPRPVNPWLRQGLRTIALAATVTVVDKSVAKTLEEQGLSGDFTVEVMLNTSMVKIEVTAESPEKARATADELVKRLTGSVAQLQSQYGLAQRDVISARRLDDGGNVEKSSLKAMTVTVFFVLLGFCAAALVSMLVDRAVNRHRGSLAGHGEEAWLTGAVAASGSVGQLDLHWTAGAKKPAMIASPPEAEETMVLPRIGKD